jgi:hypothetical protein
LNSWNRVVDWKNRKTDRGAYVYYGELNFYPYVYSDEAPVVPGEYTYYVITRDAASNQLYIYTDADIEIDFTDSSSDAIVDADNVVNFFHDDLVVPNEASSGAVALLNIYNYVLDSTVIRENFENIGGQVFAIDDIRKSLTPVSIYPNPAREYTHIDLSGFTGQNTEVTISNASGMEVWRKATDADELQRFTVNTGLLPKGIYLVKVQSDDKLALKKLMIL